MGADHPGLQLRRRERLHHQQCGRRSSPTSAPRTGFAATTISSPRKPSPGSGCRCWRAWATSTTRALATRSRRAFRIVSCCFRGNDTFSGTRLRAGYSEGIKEPSFEQTFGIPGTFPVIPNPNLKPEQNHAVEAGIEQGLFSNRAVAQRVVLPQPVSRPDRIPAATPTPSSAST